MKHLLLYAPVMHRGYLSFFERHGGNDVRCLLLGEAALSALGSEADYVIRKDLAIRGLPQNVAVRVIESLALCESVAVLEPSAIPTVERLISPDEDVTRLAVEQFFPGTMVVFDDSLRLRYDRKGVARVDPVPEDAVVTSAEAHQVLMQEAYTAAEQSRDWWLQVGALLTRNGVPLIAVYNRAMPDPGVTAILGDPRSLYSRGQGTDDTLVHHAERQLVSWAARNGISILDADAYVTHFPCVPCASSLAEAGIRRLFFREGYSRLESADILKTYGVEIIRVTD